MLHVFKLVSLVKFNFIIVIAINFVKNAYLSLLVIFPLYKEYWYIEALL